MQYCIVNKLELVGGVISRTPVGFVFEDTDRESIRSDYNSSLGGWLAENSESLSEGSVELSDFFDITPVVYEASQETTSVEGMGLSLIKDIQNIQ